MAKITYDDKVALNEEPSIAEINKVTDDNMNEIKSSVNDLYDTVSTNTTDIQNNTLDIGTLQNQTMGAEDMGSIIVESIRTKNLLDKNAFPAINALSCEVLDTGVKVITNGTGQNQWAVLRLPLTVLGKTCTLSVNASVSSSNQPMVRIFYGNETNPAVEWIDFDLSGTGALHKTNTFANTLPANCTGIYVLLYANRNGTDFPVGAYATYLNLQLEEGNEVSPYSRFIDFLDNTSPKIIFKSYTNSDSTTFAPYASAYKGFTYPDFPGYTAVLCERVSGVGNSMIHGYSHVPNTASNSVGCWVSNYTNQSVTVSGFDWFIMFVKNDY